MIDHFSRRVNGIAIFRSEPSAGEVCDFLDRAVDRVGTKPKHIITDQGGQFTNDEYQNWCTDHDVLPRWGAVGKQGSIAVVENDPLGEPRVHTSDLRATRRGRDAERDCPVRLVVQ